MNSPATDPAALLELSDDALQALAREWRTRALQGEKLAMGTAHELEVEMRRRHRVMSTGPKALATLPPLRTLGELPQKSRFWSDVLRTHDSG